VARGAIVSFSVSAVSKYPLHYQWRSNLVNIASATNTTLTLNNVQTKASASYRVVITNVYGSVTSSVAQLNVFLQYSPLSLFKNGLGTITGLTNGQVLTIGNNYTVKASSAKGFVLANWSNSVSGFISNTATITFIMQSNMVLVANFRETQRPTVTITTPINNSKLGSNTVTMIGKATDVWVVTNVSYSVNSGQWTKAASTSGYTNWTASVSLNSRTNTVLIYAQNLGGIYSLTNHLTVINTNSVTLNLTINLSTKTKSIKLVGGNPTRQGVTLNLEISNAGKGQVEYSTDLIHWNVLTNFAGTNQIMQINDPASVIEPKRFYRVVGQ